MYSVFVQYLVSYNNNICIFNSISCDAFILKFLIELFYYFGSKIDVVHFSSLNTLYYLNYV